MTERRQDENITAFTMRIIRNEIIEDCIKELKRDGYDMAAEKLKSMKDEAQ